MFVNKHKIRAVVSPENSRARDHGPILHEDEELVSIPCYSQRMSKVVREAGNVNYVQLDAELFVKETTETESLIRRGALIRFEHKPTSYYRVFDISFEEGLFGGGGQQMDIRLQESKMAVRPTHKRTDFEDDELIVVETETEERDPADDLTVDTKKRWGG